MVQVERVLLRFEIEEDAGKKNCQEQRQHAENGDRNIKPRCEIPWWSNQVSWRRSKICGARRSQWLNGPGSNLGVKHPPLNVEWPTSNEAGVMRISVFRDWTLSAGRWTFCN